MGEIIGLRIKESGKSRIKIAQDLGITTQTLRNWLKKDSLSWDDIRKIGKALPHDFTADFPYMPVEVPAIVAEDPTKYSHMDKIQTLAACKSEYEYLHMKYVQLLEIHSEIESENRQYRNKYGLLKR